MLTVYSKTHCPYCDQAKAFLTNKGVAFDVINIEEDTDAREFILGEGHRTVPQLYVGERLFVEGGWQGLSKLTDEQIKERLTK